MKRKVKSLKIEGLPELPLDLCAEYDGAAEWCARYGHKGEIGDPLPANMASDGALKYIQADPEAFQTRVRQFAYARAMNQTHVTYMPKGFLNFLQQHD